MTQATMLCEQTLLDELADSVAKDDPGQALARLDDAAGHHPQDGRLFLLRGSVFASIDEVDNARRDLSRAMLLAPGLDEARLMLGQLEYTQGQRDEARALWSAFLPARDDPSAASLLGAAMVFIIDGELEQARSRLVAALAALPSDAIRHHVESVLREVESHMQESHADERGGMSHYLLSDYLASQLKH